MIGGAVERLCRERSLLVSRRFVSQVIIERMVVWGDRKGYFVLKKGSTNLNGATSSLPLGVWGPGG